MPLPSGHIEANNSSSNNSPAPRPLYINFDLYTEGDADYKKELSSLLVDNVKELQQSLPDAIQQNNAGIFHDKCHKVKVTLSMLDDEELNNLVGELQRDIDHPHKDAFVARSQRLQDLCNLVIDSLLKEIHTP